MEQQQRDLWQDDIYEALIADCKTIGGGKGWAKKVGAMLWPHKAPDDAGKYLANCLEKNRQEKLDPEQVLWVISEARKLGSFVTMSYIAEQACFMAPTPTEPDDEVAQLQRDFIEATKIQERQIRRMERLLGFSPRSVA